MKKIGIISSFDVLCGNATYANAIVEGVSKKIDVMKIPISRSIQKRKNEKAIKEVIESAKSCDAINIQLELTLFGATPRLAVKFIKRILKSNKKKSITIHRIEPQPENIIKSIYQNIKSYGISCIFKTILQNHIKSIIYKSYKEIIITASKDNTIFIVHTKRESNRIKEICEKAKVIIHPILWPEDYEHDKKVSIKNIFKNK
ncbi:hypothetical protein, partial [Endozoicomonas atrinae]|uniref:hypothetical protein n=1 Tax=Endozoicomonas atrinae TaxID=1333660 RepID=UPI001112E233